jgi:hypothetical protein
MTRFGHHADAGSALLAVLILASAGLSLTTYAALRVRAAGEAVSARGDALCAHFAAAGAVLVPPAADLDKSDIEPLLERLASRTLRVSSHCVFVVEATCGQATRRYARDVAPGFCDEHAP